MGKNNFKYFFFYIWTVFREKLSLLFFPFLALVASLFDGAEPFVLFRLSAFWVTLIWTYITFRSLVQTEMLRLKYKVYARRTTDEIISQ